MVLFRFANRDDLNFDNIDAEPIQELDIIEDPNGDLDYPLRYEIINE